MKIFSWIGFIDTYYGDKSMSRLKLFMLRPSLRMSQQNLASEEAKICLSKSLSFFWNFQWWNYTFYKKCTKNGLVSEKNYFIFFHHRGGRGIGEYSAKKIYFFPGQRKNCEKLPQNFHFQKWKIFQNSTFLGKNCQD